MRCARTRKPDNDDRPVDLDVMDLRVAAQEIGQQQARRQQPDNPVAQGQPVEVGVAGVGVDRCRVSVQSRAEIARSEVVQAGTRNRLADEHVGFEIDGLRVELIEHLPLQWTEAWRHQVVNDEGVVRHSVALRLAF